MNWQHFQAFIWLRWRLLVNQLRRGGIFSAVIMALLAVVAVFAGVGLFIALLLVGLFALPLAPAAVLLYVWDGLVVGFLFAWCIGLVSELQRSEVLSLEKFLHLPVSLKGAFVINYLSSLLSVTMVLFVPGMVGLSLALVFTRGPAMLLVFPLLAAFLMMVTALTYQFQGWLASLMVNKRRRRSVIVVVTLVFVLLCQTPQLIHFVTPWIEQKQKDLAARLAEEEAALQSQLESGQITRDEFEKRRQESERRHKEAVQQYEDDTVQRVEQTTRLVNLCLPPGWLPLGAMDAAEGKVLPALLGTLGMSLIGAGSLWRSYRTTLRLYTGQFSAGSSRSVAVAPAARAPAKPGPAPSGLLEKELPWLSEQASVIALGGLRSLLRAPESKMLLLTPAILVVVFGSMLVTRAMDPPQFARPMMAFGAMAMILLTMAQFVGNQFGFDRGGFRVFVLCPARRRDILLGKNLAAAPLALGLSWVVLIIVEAVYPMHLDYFLAAPFQSVSMFLLFCLLGNCLSILAPLPIAQGSLKPINPKGVPLLLHMSLLMVFPLTMTPTLAPLGVALALDALGWAPYVPVCLLLSVLECVAIVFLYRLVLTWQGAFLQRREQRILELVTTKAE